MLTRLLCLMVRGYQLLLSPVIHFIGGPGSGCRFTPSCSEYMIQALQKWGPVRGLWLGLKRILRCNPWGGQGFDPVPGCNLPSPDESKRPSACREETNGDDPVI